MTTRVQHVAFTVSPGGTRGNPVLVTPTRVGGKRSANQADGPISKRRRCSPDTKHNSGGLAIQELTSSLGCAMRQEFKDWTKENPFQNAPAAVEEGLTKAGISAEVMKHSQIRSNEQLTSILATTQHPIMCSISDQDGDPNGSWILISSIEDERVSYKLPDGIHVDTETFETVPTEEFERKYLSSKVEVAFSVPSPLLLGFKQISAEHGYADNGLVGLVHLKRDPRKVLKWFCRHNQSDAYRPFTKPATALESAFEAPFYAPILCTLNNGRDCLLLYSIDEDTVVAKTPDGNPDSNEYVTILRSSLGIKDDDILFGFKPPAAQVAARAVTVATSAIQRERTTRDASVQACLARHEDDPIECTPSTDEVVSATPRPAEATNRSARRQSQNKYSQMQARFAAAIAAVVVDEERGDPLGDRSLRAFLPDPLEDQQPGTAYVANANRESEGEDGESSLALGTSQTVLWEKPMNGAVNSPVQQVSARSSRAIGQTQKVPTPAGQANQILPPSTMSDIPFGPAEAQEQPKVYFRSKKGQTAALTGIARKRIQGKEFRKPVAQTVATSLIPRDCIYLALAEEGREMELADSFFLPSIGPQDRPWNIKDIQKGVELFDHRKQIEMTGNLPKPIQLIQFFQENESGTVICDLGGNHMIVVDHVTEEFAIYRDPTLGKMIIAQPKQFQTLLTKGTGEGALFII